MVDLGLWSWTRRILTHLENQFYDVCGIMLEDGVKKVLSGSVCHVVDGRAEQCSCGVAASVFSAWGHDPVRGCYCLVSMRWVVSSLFR